MLDGDGWLKKESDKIVMVVVEEEESCGVDFSALVYPGCIIACWAYAIPLALGKLLKKLNGKKTPHHHP